MNYCIPYQGGANFQSYRITASSNTTIVKTIKSFYTTSDCSSAIVESETNEFFACNNEGLATSIVASCDITAGLVSS